MIEAKIIADSISRENNRLTTYQLRYPKFLHGELMTHRVFSRNASSSRAIPSKKLRQEAWDKNLRATPVFWGLNQKGMSAVVELSGWKLWLAKWLWGFAARCAVMLAWIMDSLGMHKQLVNRILEPFTHINVVCTATEFMNFFGLRLHKDAQPEMRTLAEKMWQEYKTSQRYTLMADEWHLPYITNNEWGIIHDLKNNSDHDMTKEIESIIQNYIKVSVARCARVSYLSFETGKQSTVTEDLKLYDRLVGAQPLHASPAEHQATPDEYKPGMDVWLHEEEWGNFRGWRQYRKMMPNESMAPLPVGYP